MGRWLLSAVALFALGMPTIASAACPEIPPVVRTPATGSPFATDNKGVTRLDAQTSDNVRITGGCIDVPQLFVNGINVEADVSYGVPWSSLGVLADGTTDNTAALNALPTGVRITADCAAGSTIRVNSTWLLKSNLDIKFLPGCTIVSYVSGVGSFAIEQADLTTPITNVTLDGIIVRKSATVSDERILRAYINHFKLLNWDFSVHGGAMFLRGSCQEIAYGRSVSTDLTTGSAGIRHIGNVPKVADACNQPADVWVHDNNIISGDGAYQSCQPLGSALWINVSSDDMLWEANRGRGSSFALIGTDGQDTFNDFTCNKIVYRNNYGTGTNYSVLISSNGGAVSNVTYSSQDFDASDMTSNQGAIYIRGDTGPDAPTFSNIVFDRVNVFNTHVQALTIDVASTLLSGVLTGFEFKNGILDSPTSQTGGGAWQPTVAIYGATNVAITNSTIHGSQAVPSVIVGNNDGDVDPRTVTNLVMQGNLIDKVPTNGIGIQLLNVAGASLVGNTIRKVSGATSTTGIKVTASSSLPGGGTEPGTTDATINGNILNDMATPIDWSCNSGSTSVAISNTGDKGHICP